MRKPIVIFIAFALFINSCMFVFAKSESASPAEQQEKYVQNCKLLNGLDIFSEDISQNIYSDYTLRRKAFSYVLDLMNIEYTGDNLAQAAVSYGLISNEGELRPDAKLTINDAVTILVNMLGYTSYAEADGGYPHSYTSVARKIGLLYDVDTSGTFITYGGFCDMLVNSLEIDMYSISEINSYNSDNLFKVSSTDENILKRNFGYDIVEGIVTENNISTLYIPAENDKGALRVGDNIYRAKDSRFSELLGHNAKLYVDENDNVVYAQAYDSNQIVIDSCDFDSLKNGKVKYFADNKSNTKKLDKSPHVIYNGVAYTGYTEKDLNEFDGEMILIDNDQDNLFEVVKINDYVTGIIKTVNVFDKAVTFEFPQDIVYRFDELSDEQISVILEDGSDVPYTYMLDKDVVSVLESKTGSSLIFKVSRKTIEGVLESISEDTVTIDDVQYEYTEEMKNKIEEYELGSTLKFALDFKGRIAGILDVYSSTFRYGYIIKVAESRGLSVSGGIKILDQDGEIFTYDFADKVRVDGVSFSKKLVASALVDTSTGSERQVVKYRTTNEKVNVIDTKNSRGGGALDTLKTTTCDSFYNNTYRTYRNNPILYGNIGGVGIIKENVTPVFRVPKIISDNPDYEFPDSYFKVYKSFGSEEATIKRKSGDYIEFVNPDEFNFSEAIVYYNNISADSVENKQIGGGMTAPKRISGNNTPVVIRSISKIIDENGDTGYRVYCTKHPLFATDLNGFWNDDTLEIYSSFDVSEEDENIIWKNVYDINGNVISGRHTFLEAGDIVQFSSEFGEINGSYVIYDISLTPNQNAKRLKSYTYGNSLGFTFGVPYSVTPDFVKFCSQYDDASGSIIVSEDKALNFVIIGQCIDISLDDPKNSTMETIPSAARSYETYGDDAGYMLVVSYNGKIKGIYCIH